MKKEELENLIKESEENKISEKELSSKYGYSYKSLYRFKKKYGLLTNKRGKSVNSRKKRIYNLNDNFFEKPNLLNSYYAGFIAADGCIYLKNKTKILSFGLSIKDIDFLLQFKKDLQFDGKIRYYKYNEKDYIMLQLSSNKICEDLEKNFNITSQKTHTLKPPLLLDNELIDSFICGYIDGDGSIGLSKNKEKQRNIFISIIGTKEILLWIKNRFSLILEEEINKKLCKNNNGFNKEKESYNVYQLSLQHKKGREIYSFLYNVNAPKFKRKWTSELYDYCLNFKKLNKKIGGLK